INSIEMTEPEKSFMIQPSEFTKSEIDVFNDAIQTATILAQNNPRQDWLSVLFKTSERLHARKLFYSLLNLDIQIADSLLNDKIREIRTNNQQLRASQKLLLEEKRTDLFNQNVSRVVSLMAYQETIQMKLQSLRGELNLLYPNFKNLFTYPTTSFEEIQRSLTPGQALLKYIPLEKTLVILQLQADTARFYEVNVSNKELKELNRKFYETVFSIHKNPISPALMDQNLKELNTVLRKLSEHLIAPVKLHNCNELIILSAPALAGFPFETLYGDIEKQQYLIEKMPIRYISVGQVIQRSYTHYPTQPLEFTLIDGAKNGSKQKVMETNRIDFKEIHINPSNARQSTQLSQLKNRAGIFHLVSGGEWFAPDISNSFLKFNFDQNTENLTQALWFKLQFDKKSLLLFSNMLIIPEFDNLNYFLLYDVLKMMGSQNFLISHWPIPPEVSPRLISQLTDKLKSGIDLTQALQSAKKDILSKKDFRHPYYWAGFQYYQ
ncbi:CHAT domain-containing protein, partial [candidate division KSB1 bacterium]|nr:CHAT domain-containing protein [candidate division KSB1 bacterium]